MRFKFGLGAACALVMGFSGAQAGTMKPGEWQFTMTMPGMRMPANLPPAVLAQMQARGISMGGNTISTPHCVTPEEAAKDTPHVTRSDSGCTESNLSEGEGQVSFSLQCTGKMVGTGSVVMTRSPDHFDGDYSFTGNENGRQVSQKFHMTGQYVSSTCTSTQ
jgi:hypothetical protein